MKITIVFMFLLLLPLSVYAETPHHIGLFADVDHTETCVSSDEEIYFFDLYVMVYPGYKGQNGVYFSITYPDDVYIISTHRNDEMIRAYLGDLVYDFNIAYHECLEDGSGWVSLCRIEMLCVTSTESWIEIAPHPIFNRIEMSSCYCQGDFCSWGIGITPFNKFGVNRECPPDNPIGVEESSWGRIKQILK